jgi:hypothetical protein
MQDFYKAVVRFTGNEGGDVMRDMVGDLGAQGARTEEAVECAAEFEAQIQEY